MPQISVRIEDEALYEWFRARVTADRTISSQVIEAMEEYRKHGTRRERETEALLDAQNR